jgi:hypothetical protein
MILRRSGCFTNDVDVPIILLTQSGRELLGLIEDISFNLDYIKAFASMVKKKNPKAVLQYVEIIDVSSEKVHYKAPAIDL